MMLPKSWACPSGTGNYLRHPHDIRVMRMLLVGSFYLACTAAFLALCAHALYASDRA